MRLGVCFKSGIVRHGVDLEGQVSSRLKTDCRARETRTDRMRRRWKNMCFSQRWRLDCANQTEEDMMGSKKGEERRAKNGLTHSLNTRLSFFHTKVHNVLAPLCTDDQFIIPPQKR